METILDETTTFQPLPFTLELPDTEVDIHILKATFEFSKSKGLPQWKFDTEILAPEFVEIKGEKYSLSGKPITSYASISRDAYKAATGMLYWLNACNYSTKMTLENPQVINDKNGSQLAEPFNGKVVKAIIGTGKKKMQEKVVLSEAERLAGKPEYQDIKDESGKPVFRNEVRIKRIVGPSEVVL
jgi:hypothetical protein